MLETIYNGNRYSFILSVVLGMSLLLTGGCSFVRHSIAAMRSTEHFIPNKKDARVLFEPGAEDYADKIALFLPAAIRQIEEKQYNSFVKPVAVYICASRESFKKLYGADVRAGMLTKLFLSPRVFEHGDEIGKKYLMHELSHLHLWQQLGFYKMSKLPMWFKEGLATYVSNGGGGHLVSQKQAMEYIRSGKHFVPNDVGGFIFRKTPSDFGLRPHMFYHQSMMFIRYLATIDQPAFQRLLSSVENGESLSAALQASYHKQLKDLWSEFLYKIGKMG